MNESFGHIYTSLFRSLLKLLMGVTFTGRGRWHSFAFELINLLIGCDRSHKSLDLTIIILS